MEIFEYAVEQLIDPTGILEGNRFEYFLHVEVDEEDELYSEHGVGIRVLYVEVDGEKRIASYHFFERGTDKIIDFEMEDDEFDVVFAFCQEHLPTSHA